MYPIGKRRQRLLIMRSGIYEIVNLTNGAKYVGSTVDFVKRRNEHICKLRKRKHPNRFLQSAWNKYGSVSFAFRRLIICSKEHLLFFEQRAFDVIRPEYNLCQVAGNTLGRKLSAQTKQKISDANRGRVMPRNAVERGAETRTGRPLSPEHRATLLGNKRALGTKHTDEWKAENSRRMTGVPRPKSPEQRAKISQALKGVTHSPERRAKQAAAQTGLKRKPYKLKNRTCE